MKWTGPIIITGDTNIDLLETDSNIVAEYKNVLQYHGLKQHITKATRKGRTLIDHIASNVSKVNYENVLPCDEISDHDGPYVIFNVKKPRFEPRYKYIRVEKNFNTASFVSDVEKLPFAAVYGLESSEDKLHCFNELFLSCLDQHAPLVKCKITRPPAPWLHELNLSNKLRERNRLRQLAHQRPHNEQVWTEFRKIKNELKKDIRNTKAKFYKKALSSKRPKVVWNTIHRILNPSHKSINADPNILNDHFNTTAVRLLNSIPKTEDTLNQIIEGLPETPESFNFVRTTYIETRKAIRALRNDCSTGQDKIPSKFLKLCINEITGPICHIINTAIEEKSFPEQWKISKITPIPKIDQPLEPSDYRPISILPILSKVYEKILMQQIVNHIESQQLLSKNQSGFRKGHCTITTCMKIKSDILKAMDTGEITLSVMADFSKAFDTVDFETLIRKLHQLNFSKSSLLILSSYLSNRKQFVQINDKESKKLTVLNGVPQGSILGPFLFNIYVHDMSANTDAECIQYADDTSLYRHTKPRELAECVEKVNNDVKNIQTWSQSQNLLFNAKKTKTMLFATQQMARRHEFDYEIRSIDDKTIERVKDFKLLGVTFSQDMKWNAHVNLATFKAYGTLKTLSKIKRFMPYHVRKQLAESLVLSRLDYGNALYYNAPKYLHQQLQRIQNATASFVRGRYSKVTDVIALKWLPIEERAEFSMAKLGWKSIRSDNWPSFLPMKEMPERRGTRNTIPNGTMLECPNIISGSFEYDSSQAFNKLPRKCRDEMKYENFCSETKNFLLDQAFAKNLI